MKLNNKSNIDFKLFLFNLIIQTKQSNINVKKLNDILIIIKNYEEHFNRSVNIDKTLAFNKLSNSSLEVNGDLYSEGFKEFKSLAKNLIIIKYCDYAWHKEIKEPLNLSTINEMTCHALDNVIDYKVRLLVVIALHNMLFNNYFSNNSDKEAVKDILAMYNYQKCSVEYQRGKWKVIQLIKKQCQLFYYNAHENQMSLKDFIKKLRIINNNFSTLLEGINYQDSIINRNVFEPFIGKFIDDLELKLIISSNHNESDHKQNLEELSQQLDKIFNHGQGFIAAHNDSIEKDFKKLWDYLIKLNQFIEKNNPYSILSRENLHKITKVILKNHYIHTTKDKLDEKYMKHNITIDDFIKIYQIVVRPSLYKDFAKQLLEFKREYALKSFVNKLFFNKIIEENLEFFKTNDKVYNEFYGINCQKRMEVVASVLTPVPYYF